MKYYEIGPVISEKLAVFPGDQPFRRQVHMSYQQGHDMELSSLSSTLHIGAHADAPLHYHPQGKSIDQVDLNYYLGLCQVVSITAVQDKGGRINKEDFLPHSLQAPRILFRTGSFPDPGRWNSDFFSFHPDFLDYLGSENILTVGIDTPSVDPSDSKDLPAHAALYRHHMANLEGLDLSGVEDGLYQLVALPLKIAGAEAAPVRAILYTP